MFEMCSVPYRKLGLLDIEVKVEVVKVKVTSSGHIY